MKKYKSLPVAKRSQLGLFGGGVIAKKKANIFILFLNPFLYQELEMRCISSPSLIIVMVVVGCSGLKNTRHADASAPALSIPPRSTSRCMVIWWCRWLEVYL